MTTKELAAEIKRGMQIAFFSCAYADQADECDQPLRGEITEQLPDEIDPAAIHAADNLAIAVTGLFNYMEPGLNTSQQLAQVYLLAAGKDKEGADREMTPELFGHYLAMQAMGTGVGMESFGYEVRELFDRLPYVEFGSHSLQKEYFQYEEK